MREIRRFNKFYEFFLDYLQKKKDASNKSGQDILGFEPDPFYKNLDYIILQKYSIILGVFMCYYLRIIDNKTRKKFEEMMNEEMKNLDKYFDKRDFLEVPIKEEEYVLKNIDLEKGIAQNRALLDNIFSIFVAINIKLPLFIVGKPGCSKSLSIQLINKSMKGEASNKPLFRNLPKIILSSYQGSMASTSKGVENIFKRAKRQYESLKDEYKDSNISMIFFDEMGLAEHSPNNPLKVLHAELDEALEEGTNKIAFVGISNWKLDASKMNRGMHLSIPDPDKGDTIKTALTIGKSYDENLATKFSKFYEELGITYFRYKQYLNKTKGKEDFHGNRDFYHLIKYSARKIVDKNKKNELNDNTQNSIAYLGLERNFGGLQIIDESTNKVNTSIKMIKTLYSKKKEENNYEVLKRIKENLMDEFSRYLLVISKSAASIFLISNILPETKKDYNLYVGSQFSQDHHSEEYSLKILNKIQMRMEEDKVLILKNLEPVYPALYDLFNQNFTKVSNKNYARIAIGSSINNFSLVNDNFRCIVSVNTEQIEEEETPFLNRFEKHIVSLEYLLDNEMIEESKNIYKQLKEIIVLDKKTYKGISYDLDKILINFELDEIQGIMFQAIQRKVDKEHLIDEVIKKLSMTFPQDIILCLRLNGFSNKNPKLLEKIIDGYIQGEHNNLKSFLEKTEQKKNIIYTYNNNLEKIKILKPIDTKIVGKISEENIKEININKFKSESEFEKSIDDFLEDEKQKICFIKFNPNEGSFINYCQFFLENKQKDFYEDKKEKNQSQEKAFIFIVNIVRIYDYELEILKDKKKTKKEKRAINKKILKETISNLSDYNQIFIDNLYGPDKIKLDSIVTAQGLDIYEHFLDFSAELSKNIYVTLSYVKLNIPFSYGELNEDSYINKLIEYISNNEGLKNSFNDCVKKQIGDNKKDFIKELFKKPGIIKANDKDIVKIIIESLTKEYTNYLAQFYFKAETDNFFATLLSLEEEKKMDESKKEEISKIQEGIKKRYFSEFKIDKKKKIVRNQGQNLITIYLGIRIPNIIPIIKKIIQFIGEEIEKKYIKNENNLRKEGESNKINYEKNLKLYNESLYEEISKISLLKQISEYNNENKENEIYNIFKEDFYTFFIWENLKK